MVTNTRKPMVFVLSSTESGQIRDVLVDCLTSVAEVIPWNREELWQPGEFIADRLLEFPYGYDFAIAIFGADDKTLSRGLKAYQPRDNVIFETGMFMSHLGRDRTFIVLPKTPPVKVLTDLSGLITLNYPAEPDSLGGWKDALKPLCQRIVNHIQTKGPRPGTISLGPKGFFTGHQVVLDLLRTNPKGIKPRVVKNIALDMEVTWPLVKNNLLLRTELLDVQWHSLMMDSKSRKIKPFSSKAVSVNTAANQAKDIIECSDELTRAKRDRNVVFECRVYTDPPILHGFLIDNDTLLLNMCGLTDGKLQSADHYVLFKNEPQNAVATDYITVFATWFDHKWTAASRTIWPNP